MPEERETPLIERVRELAQDRGVSERTVWRWIAKMRRDGEPPAFKRDCAAGGHPLTPGGTMGRRYCNAACRVRAHRRRRRKFREQAGKTAQLPVEAVSRPRESGSSAGVGAGGAG